MSAIALWLLSVGVATLGAAGSAELRSRISLRARAKRAALRLPRTRIEDVRAGELVRVEGRIEFAEATLLAPLSQRRCAHYMLSVEYGRDNKRFVTALSETKTVPFFVADESGRALIEIQEPLVEAVIDQHWTALKVDAETRFELERYLFGRGETGRALLAEPRRLRYAEGALEAGERVLVTGLAEWADAPEVGHTYRNAGRRLLLRTPKRSRVFVTDQPED